MRAVGVAVPAPLRVDTLSSTQLVCRTNFPNASGCLATQPVAQQQRGTAILTRCSSSFHRVVKPLDDAGRQNNSLGFHHSSAFACRCSASEDASNLPNGLGEIQDEAGPSYVWDLPSRHKQMQRNQTVLGLRAALDFRITLKPNLCRAEQELLQSRFEAHRAKVASYGGPAPSYRTETRSQSYAGRNEGKTDTTKEMGWTSPRQYREERSLNRRIIEAPDADYVLAVVMEAFHRPQWGQPSKIPLSPLNCATALHRIAKRMDEASMRKSARLTFARRAEMRAFVGAAVSAFPECSGQGLANIAWALSKIGGSALFTEEMDLLADAALDKLLELNAQNLANTAGAFSSMLHAAPLLFDAVAARAGALAETFRPQELVQLLWAFACMNHSIDPLFDSLDVLLKPASFTGFSQQQLASMAWSSAVLGQMNRPWFSALWGCINARSVDWTSPRPRGAQHSCQLYQANLAIGLECANSALSTERALEGVINEAWEKEKAASCKLGSGDHREVDRLLVGATGRVWVSEYLGAPYSLDLALVEARVGLEIDGPSHFSRNSNTLLGHTVLKRRLLRAAGWTVIPIPFHEWEELRGEQERKLYLRQLLDGSI